MYSINLAEKGYFNAKNVYPNQKAFEKYGFEFKTVTGEEIKFSWPSNIEFIANSDGSAKIYLKKDGKNRECIGKYNKKTEELIMK